MSYDYGEVKQFFIFQYPNTNGEIPLICGPLSSRLYYCTENRGQTQLGMLKREKV